MLKQDINDWQLIEACRQRDEMAWDMLVRRYDGLLFYIALKQGLSQEDAADIVQLTFTFLLESLNVFDETSNIKAWLRVVLKRQAWRWRKRQEREQVGKSEDVGTLEIGAYTDIFDLDQQSANQQLHDALLQLGERCYDLLYTLYFDVEEQSYEEIAAELNIAIGSIGPTRSRCLKKLKRLMEKEMQN